MLAAGQIDVILVADEALITVGIDPSAAVGLVVSVIVIPSHDAVRLVLHAAELVAAVIAPGEVVGATMAEQLVAARSSVEDVAVVMTMFCVVSAVAVPRVLVGPQPPPSSPLVRPPPQRRSSRPASLASLQILEGSLNVGLGRRVDETGYVVSRIGRTRARSNDRVYGNVGGLIDGLSFGAIADRSAVLGQGLVGCAHHRLALINGQLVDDVARMLTSARLLPIWTRVLCQRIRRRGQARADDRHRDGDLVSHDSSLLGRGIEPRVVDKRRADGWR